MFAGRSTIDFEIEPSGKHRLISHIKTIHGNKFQLTSPVDVEVRCLRPRSWAHSDRAFKLESKWNWYHSTDTAGVWVNFSVCFT